ncbi:MAG: hypoxanthine phosphoribosyltransferase [Nitrospinae bacterium]|nr:hypoxanthine phosphoribosyltransferase [Nitrospinota bacterium]
MPADEILITEADIRSRLTELAKEINAALPEGPVHVVMILKGAIIFGVDLARALMRNATLGFLAASSYGAGTKSKGRVQIDTEHLGEVEGRNVLLIDDILDTGHTFSKTIDILKSKRPASLRTCVLMDKPARREVDIHADHVGFAIENHFVVGYGLDCDEAYRTLPDIRIYAPE